MANNGKPVRPVEATDDVLDWLDDLRDSGATNMFGAAVYLVAEFGFSIQVASRVLVYWMETFADRHP